MEEKRIWWKRRGGKEREGERRRGKEREWGEVVERKGRHLEELTREMRRSTLVLIASENCGEKF